MDWLQQNLDAYRVVTEILNDLRTTVRQELELNKGKLWYRTGLPQGVLDRLIERKEKEKAIDWYENEYQQLIDFASFADILEILEFNTALVPSLRRLAPNTALLHARFLELEVMREKLAMTRPISEAELGFLTTFHSRFRKALEQVKVQEQQEAAAEPVAASTKGDVDKDSTADDAEADADLAPAEPRDDSAEEAESREEEDEADEQVGSAPTESDQASGQGSKGRESRPPSRSAFVPQSSTSTPPPPKAPNRAAARGAAAVAEPAVKADNRRSVQSQLEESDTRGILRSLYREVTTVAEGLWTSEIPPATAVWNQVSAHPWYEKNISKLGLKPLSDFYEIIFKVEEKMNGGIARDQLQDFLKESNFAKVLLSLRDMFQHNGI